MKHRDKKQHKVERVYFGMHIQVIAHRDGEWQQERLEGAGHITSAVKSREHAGAQVPFFTL